MASLHQGTEETITVGPVSYPPRPRGRRGEKRKLRLTLGPALSPTEGCSASVKYRVVLKCGYENKKEKIVGKALLSKH